MTMSSWPEWSCSSLPISYFCMSWGQCHWKCPLRGPNISFVYLSYLPCKVMLSIQPTKAVDVLVGFHDAVSFYETQNAHENTILFTAYNSQKTLWTMFMGLFITKSTFYKPKMWHAFPESYCSRVSGTHTCRTHQRWKDASRYFEHETDFSSVRST